MSTSVQVVPLESSNLDRPGRVFVVLSVMTVLLGVFFRSQGFFDGSISLWLDEAEWAMKLVDLPLLVISVIRPVGFMMVTEYIVSIGGSSEVTLRLLAYLGSLISLPLIYLVSREVFKSHLITLAALFLLAFNPLLINFAKEFKPYSLELSCHLLLIFLTLYAIRLPKSPVFYFVPVVAFAGFFFAYNLVFLYPAVFLLLLHASYKHKQHKRLVYTVVTSVALLVTIYLWYKLQWSGDSMAGQEQYWGEKYDVFNLSPSLFSNVTWFFNKYYGMVIQSCTAGSVSWYSGFDLRPVQNVIFGVAHVLGLVALCIRKDLKNGLLICSPILTLVIFNFMGHWPFGPFRTNLFMFSYFILVTLYGIDFLVGSKRWTLRIPSVSVLILCAFMLQAPLDWSRYKSKPNSSIGAVIETILDYHLNRSGSEAPQIVQPIILADLHSYYPLVYYFQYDARVTAEIKSRYPLITPIPIFIDGGLNRGKVDHLLQWPPSIAYIAPIYVDRTRQVMTRHGRIGPNEVWFAISKKMVADKAVPFFDRRGEIVKYKKRFGDSNLLIRVSAP